VKAPNRLGAAEFQEEGMTTGKVAAMILRVARVPSAVRRQYLARVPPSGAAASRRRHLGERYMGLVLFVRCGGG
jgi:hypothetical protein